MKIRDVMTGQVVSVGVDETVAVAARMLQRHNIGALPVCGKDGRLRGIVTDRDIVTRCIAVGKAAEKTTVKEVMTSGVTVAAPDMETGAAAHLMGRMQVRRLPVVENGKLQGMVSLADLAVQEESCYDAADALGSICENVSFR